MSKFNISVFLPLCMVIQLLIMGCSIEGTSPTKSSSSSSKDTILLGFQGPLTLSTSVFGISTLAGTELAIEEINAEGGIDGKLIELIYSDSKGDQDESIAIAKDMVNTGVCAVIGEPTSGTAQVTLDIYNRAKIPVLLSGATATGLTDGKPFIFRNALLDAKGVPFLLDYMVFGRNFKNFAIITVNGDTYSEGLADVFRDHIPRKGAKIIAEQFIKSGDTNFSKQVSALRNKNIDVVVFTGYYQEGAELLLELEKQGVDAIMIGADGLQSSGLWEIAKDASIGTIYFAGFSDKTDTKRVEEFNEKLNARNATSDMYSAQAYDAVYLIAKVLSTIDIEDCANESDRIKIKDKLARIRYFDGIAGKMSFDIDRNAIKVPFIQEIYKTGVNNYNIRVVE